MTNAAALAAYDAALTAEEASHAFDLLAQLVASDIELPDDADFESGDEAMLNENGRPGLSGKLREIELASL